MTKVEEFYLHDFSRDVKKMSNFSSLEQLMLFRSTRMNYELVDTFLAFLVTLVEAGDYKDATELLLDSFMIEWENGREAMKDGILYGM